MTSLKTPNGLLFFKNIIISLTLFFLPLLFFDMGFDGLQIGVLMSSFTIVTLFSTFPIGVINDKLSIKYVTVIGMLLESLFFFGLYLFRDFWIILAFFAAGALGGNMIDTSIRGMTLKVTETLRRGRRLGRFQAVTSGGAAIGILFGGLMLFTLQFSGVLLISAVAFFIMALGSLFITEVKSAKFPMSDYKAVLLKKKTAFFLLPLFIFGIHWGAEHTSYTLFLREGLGLNLVASGLYMSVAIMGLALASLKTGSFIDRGGNNKIMFFIGLVISGIGHILMTVPIVPLSFAFRLMHEIGDGITFVSFYVGFSKIFKTERIAGESSAAMSIIMIGAAIGSLVFGPLGYSYGFGWPLIISGALSILIVFVLFPLQKKLSL
ncbi:MAG: MFS transporter [Candidatus Aenigmatarchaeota archaeon]|nr:MAG: MFS transporter [Candidatus Aenigmarchaeota archaeon]